jgi:hypothetical protein
MMKKPRCGVKDKFEFEEDGQKSGRKSSTGIHSEDNDSASDSNCQGPGLNLCLISVKLSSTCFKQIIVFHQEVCTSS